MRLVNNSRPLLFFMIILSLKGTGFERKNKGKSFKGFLIIFFQNILFLKEFLTSNRYFGLFTQFKKGFGTSVCSTSSPWFFHKYVPYLILNWQITIDKVLMSYLFSFSRYQTICVTKFLFTQLMTSWTLRFISKGKMDIQKYEYLESEKSFLDEIKIIFHNYLRAITWWKN